MLRAVFVMLAVSNQAVLVNLVKFMETPKRIIPSFVWFERIESFYNILPKSLYFSTNIGRHVLRGALDNGELIPASFFDSVSQGKGISDMVKRTPEIMEHVANDVENFERDVRNTDEIITALSLFQIILERDSIWLAIPESLEGHMQILDVLFGPFDF